MFITIEGVDGAGKSTVIQEVQQDLEDINYSVETTHEPSPKTEQGKVQ